MSEQKTIEQYADEYSETKYPLEKLIDFEKITVLQVAAQSAFLSGAEKQKELDAEKIKDYEQALKFECDNRCSDLNPCSAKEVLKKWGRG